MKTLRDIPHLEGVPVLVRAALNVPLENGRVANAFRLRAALPTVEYLRKEGAKVILAGHIGDTGTETLAPVAQALGAFVSNLAFAPSAIGPEARQAARDLVPGGVLMLENLRRHKGEKENDPAFAAELASLADVFVQDSFDVCHRSHASVVGVPELLPSYAGLQLALEVRELGKALAPKHPALAVIGGAKFATKEPVLEMLVRNYDSVFVGGALANDFMRARGMPVGASLVSDVPTQALASLASHPRIALPRDYVVAPFGGTRGEGRVAALEDVGASEAILDDGPETVAHLAELASRAKTILWNGPLGNYENGFTDATEAFARAVASSDAHTIVGGGDTIAAIEKLGIADDVSFISTGGGAMLDFLADGTLPGIAALG